MKKDKKPYTWKDALWNGLAEIIITFAAMGIGFSIAFLLPREAIKSIPAELFFALGGIILFTVIGIVLLIVHLIKEKKETKDLQFICNELKNRYKLTLMKITKNEDGEMLDIFVIRGKSSKGKFELFKEGEIFNFSVEYFHKGEKERYAHEFPKDVNESISCIEKFMS